jgi:hypothetical protein
MPRIGTSANRKIAQRSPGRPISPRIRSVRCRIRRHHRVPRRAGGVATRVAVHIEGGGEGDAATFGLGGQAAMTFARTVHVAKSFVPAGSSSAAGGSARPGGSRCRRRLPPGPPPPDQSGHADGRDSGSPGLAPIGRTSRAGRRTSSRRSSSGSVCEATLPNAPVPGGSSSASLGPPRRTYNQGPLILRIVGELAAVPGMVASAREPGWPSCRGRRRVRRPRGGACRTTRRSRRG